MTTSSSNVDDVLKSQQFVIGGTSRPELNGKVVYLIGNPGGGRLRVKLLEAPHTEYALKAEHLKQLGFVHTLRQAAGRLDFGEVRKNLKVLWRRPLVKLGLGVLAIAVLSSRGGARARAKARPTRFGAHEEFSRSRPPPHIAEAYALGYADAYKNRDFGASLDEGEDHGDLVAEVLEDLPPETQGLRDEWAVRQGVGRREPVGRGARR